MSSSASLSGSRTQLDVERAIAGLLDEFSWNDWFIHSFWPENQKRVRLMVDDVISRIPPSASARILDVGCYNGFNSFLFSQLGYQVTATDAVDIATRQSLFEKSGIAFFFSNLNESNPFPHIPDSHFDVVLMGEVIEHILNHPLGLMRHVSRVMRPGGLLILTTPNPATVTNALRMLRGTATLWGTISFMELPKIEREKIIDIGDVHYREYLTSEIEHLLTASGFVTERVNYFGFGVSRQQSFFKRSVKGNLVARKLMSNRLFGSNQYFVALKQFETDKYQPSSERSR